jgi:hypothetical protein
MKHIFYWENGGGEIRMKMKNPLELIWFQGQEINETIDELNARRRELMTKIGLTHEERIELSNILKKLSSLKIK